MWHIGGKERVKIRGKRERVVEHSSWNCPMLVCFLSLKHVNPFLNITPPIIHTPSQGFIETSVYYIYIHQHFFFICLFVYIAGHHCSEATCKLLDFLPFECALCHHIFCLEHHSLSAHQCHVSDVTLSLLQNFYIVY